MNSGDLSQRADGDVEVRKLLHELDELHELDRKRRLQPRGSAAYTQAVREVDRRCRALIDRLRVTPRYRLISAVKRSGGQMA